MRIKILLWIILAIAASACTRTSIQPVDEQKLRTESDSLVYANRNIDSLQVLLNRFSSEGNSYGEIAACRELGRCLRDASRFGDALDAHKRGLKVAEECCDTIQIIQALNNIGTDFRRMGILEDASTFHYKALTCSDLYSDKTSKTAVKNRVVSLNGIGNVQLTLGDLEQADSIFRMALKGEQSLGSALGQAINYANIGAIMEERGQKDSALVYYGKSLEFNEKANSKLGISLCRSHFGRIWEEEGNYDKAIAEYKIAYDLMNGQSDIWHALESALSLSRVNIARKNWTEARKYLNTSKAAAHKINSREHLAEVYRQEYLLEESTGHSKKALEAYIKSREYADSLASETAHSNIQRVRIQYEKEKKQAEIDTINRNWSIQREAQKKITSILALGVLLAFLAIGILVWSLILRGRNQRMAREMETMKSSFFTNITHEFRTPLTVIHSAADHILKGTPAESPYHRDAQDIIRHQKSLLSLINQILDIAKLTSGTNNSPEYSRGDIVGYIRMICESHQAYARSKEIRIIYAPAEKELEMDFIPDYIRQIVGNLLSNAIKFSAKGTDVLLSSNSTGNNFSLTVSDQGKGMSPEVLRDIFKPFYQAPDDSIAIGTGVGLSIVKLDVEAMHGSIEVHSAEGKGTIFNIVLPINCTEPVSRHFDLANTIIQEGFDENFEEETVNEDIIHDDRENATRILIVEDTPEVARLQMNQLNPDFNYYFARNGREGLEKAKEIVPDLIITDVMMPVMDGWELCRSIRSSQALNHIPVIMVTAKCSHEDKIAGLEAGADAFVEKPFHADELNVRVKKLLEQRSLLQKKWASEGESGDNADVPQASRKFVNDFTDAVNKCLISGELDHNLIAAALCVTRTQLNRKIKAITGLTTTEYISQIRISLAKKLLDNESLLIGDIAQRCGVDDVAYFSAIFKKATGYTPSRWRNRKKYPNS